MVGLNGRARSLLLSVSLVSIVWALPAAVYAQAQGAQADAGKQAHAKRKKNDKKDATSQAQSSGGWQTAYAQVGQPVEAPLDAITVAATKTGERTIDTLAGVSKITTGEIEQLAPSRTSDIFFSTPSVSFQERGDEPGSAIAVRGLQDFGRVAVVIDGARQNFQRTGHNANGYFYLDPAMIAEADVVRGPVANIYGSGAIGGVVSFRTKDVEDVLRAGERWGVLSEGSVGTNLFRGNVATFAAGRSENVEAIVGGSYRTQDNYKNGNGVEVPNTHQEIQTGLAKLTIRPADGHEVKLGFLGYDARYDTGQPSVPNTSAYATKTTNTTATLSWKYQRPEDRIFDFKASAYFNGTDTDQTKIAGANNPITGNIGDHRSFTVNTTGLDVYNTTRFDTGPVAQAVTYGGDFFSDKVTVVDPTGASAYTTPNGRREVGGGFIQLKSNYSTWFEMINAVRYDNYALSSSGFNTGGDRFSPKSTIGITPVEWMTVYGTYAEGYRAPSVTETLVSGNHPAFAVSGPSTQFGSLFTLLPNLALKPEVGKTKEVGLNFRFNDTFTPGDKIRAKVNVFRNDIDNYIDLVSFGPGQPIVSICPGPPGFCPVPIPWLPVQYSDYSLVQYQNVANARIEGVELESTYDAGTWFAGLAGSWMKGVNMATGEHLSSVPGHKIVTTLGVRLLDQKVTAAVRWASVGAQSGLSSTFVPATSYNLVNIFLGYQPTPDILASFTIDNLLDVYYLPYATLKSTDGTDTALAGSAPGRTYKASLRIRFGAS
jgi:hemoglobin/transferrin/lactoferrin receptor protein